MSSTTAAGTGLAISAASPATFDETGFEALSFIEVNNVEQLGGFGTTFAEVEFQPLKGPTQTYKGGKNNGQLQPAIALDEDDAGQALLATASADETQKQYSIRVTKPDGGIRYFGSRVFGMPETIGGRDTIIMANPVIRIVTDIVRVSPA